MTTILTAAILAGLGVLLLAFFVSLGTKGLQDIRRAKEQQNDQDAR